MTYLSTPQIKILVRLVELLNLHKIRCKIPLYSGAYRKNLSFLIQKLLIPKNCSMGLETLKYLEDVGVNYNFKA
jgi:hypothetical protein